MSEAMHAPRFLLGFLLLMATPITSYALFLNLWAQHRWRIVVPPVWQPGVFYRRAGVAHRLFWITVRDEQRRKTLWKANILNLQ